MLYCFVVHLNVTRNTVEKWINSVNLSICLAMGRDIVVPIIQSPVFQELYSAVKDVDQGKPTLWCPYSCKECSYDTTHYIAQSLLLGNQNFISGNYFMIFFLQVAAWEKV